MSAFAGKVAVVTGAASGIGAATARRFVERGGRVVVADLQEDAGERLAEEIGSDAIFVRTDVTQESGAHVTIRKSHDKKSMHMLMSPGIYSEDRLREYYGPDSEDIIEGPAGTGFFEDVACYHKLLPPKKEDRLVLAITYS